ncbi:MAG: hypothetical protein RL156_1662 [Bacteroidota bacterium]|jgi:histidine ammonia-lyase
MTLLIDGSSLTLDALVAAAGNGSSRIELSADARERVTRARTVVEQWVNESKVIYGVTTGFGEFANVVIPPGERENLQENLILSHAVGAGELLSSTAVRAMMILRVNALAKGHSGVRLSTLQTLCDVFNAGIVPAVPSQGSVGSSGDLVQLSHIALVLIGKGRCLVSGNTSGTATNTTNAMNSSNTISAADALAAHGITPVRLQAKEGLALINGTQMQCGVGSLALHKALRLADLADVSGALSADVLRSTDRAYDARLHALRPHMGQQQSAARLRELMSNSALRESHRTDDTRVQDAYSIRCMPQVHGASRDALRYVKSVFDTELNSVTDNPLIFPDDHDHVEGGNFHGQPLALALDFLAIAASELANISERRIERMVNGALSNGLPRFLTKNGGVQSGMMIAQYTAASIVSENKVLAHPASVDSIPTSANQEDHNSMGSIAANKALKVVENLQTVLAIELLCAAQALDFHRPLTTGPTLERVHAVIRTRVPFAQTDRILYDDVSAVRDLIESGALEAVL